MPVTWQNIQIPDSPDYYPLPEGGDRGYGEPPPWWAVLGPGIIAGSSATLSNIFRKYPEQPTYRPYQTTYGAGLPATNYSGGGGGGVGIGVDGQGIRLSDGSHIGWLPIAAVVLGFFLLQSQGFSRRRNPASSARKRNPARRKQRGRRSRRR